MKKSLFGYNVSETDITLNALREENESLNATIIDLKTQIKNIASEENVKVSLLENKIIKNNEALQNAANEKRELLSQIAMLSEEMGKLRNESEAMRIEIEAVAAEASAAAVESSSQIRTMAHVQTSAAASHKLLQRRKHKTSLRPASEEQHVTSVLKSIGGIRKKIIRGNQELARSIKETPGKK